MKCTLAFLRDCEPVFAQLFHPERTQWNRDNWVPYCKSCLDAYLDGCDDGLYREPKAIMFRAVLS